eukprot:RCo049043
MDNGGEEVAPASLLSFSSTASEPTPSPLPEATASSSPPAAAASPAAADDLFAEFFSAAPATSAPSKESSPPAPAAAAVEDMLFSGEASAGDEATPAATSVKELFAAAPVPAPLAEPPTCTPPVLPSLEQPELVS